MAATQLNFRQGAKVRTSFECPKYSARIGHVLKQDNQSCEVLIQPIEKDAESIQTWINKKHLSLTK